VPGPYRSEFAAYTASKFKALRHADDWVKRVRACLNVVYLHPGFMLGRNDAVISLMQAKQGINGIVLALLFRQEA